jgi:hypothetical protein
VNSEMKLKTGIENDDLAMAFFEEVQESETTGVDSGSFIPKMPATGKFSRNLVSVP